MIIKSLKLKNYRNYELLNMAFDSRTNILYGDNAQGKTNILEALYLSGTTKSHRGTKDRDMIRFGEEESHIETIVEKKMCIRDSIDSIHQFSKQPCYLMNDWPVTITGSQYSVHIFSSLRYWIISTFCKWIATQNSPCS